VGELKEKEQYELNYEAGSYGRHTFAAVATDNEGRPCKSYSVDVYVNGQTQIKFLSPTPNEVMKGPIESEIELPLQAFSVYLEAEAGHPRLECRSH
jgi:hypothetical protein